MRISHLIYTGYQLFSQHFFFRRRCGRRHDGSKADGSKEKKRTDKDKMGGKTRTGFIIRAYCMTNSQFFKYIVSRKNYLCLSAELFKNCTYFR